MILGVNWAQLGGSFTPCDTSLGYSPRRVQLAEMSMMLTHIPSTFVGQWRGWVELGHWLLCLSHSMQSLGLSLFTWPLQVVSSLSPSRRVTGFLRGGSGLSWNAQNHIIHLLLINYSQAAEIQHCRTTWLQEAWFIGDHLWRLALQNCCRNPGEKDKSLDEDNSSRGSEKCLIWNKICWWVRHGVRKKRGGESRMSLSFWSRQLNEWCCH